MFKKIFSSGPSIDVLHEEYAKKGVIDTNAATKSKESIVINASIEKVWELLIHPEKWYTFYPGFRNVKLTVLPKVDDTFSFTFNRITLNERFSVVTPLKELTWTGTVLWFKSIDRHTLKIVDKNTTRVTIEESLTGKLVPLIMTSNGLKKQHQGWLKAFKKGVEEA